MPMAPSDADIDAASQQAHDPRRIRLLKLLDREEHKSRAFAYSNSPLRGARSLSSLHEELQTSRATAGDATLAVPTSVVSKKKKKHVSPAAFLSPLKCRAKAGYANGLSPASIHPSKSEVALTARASGLFNLCESDQHQLQGTHLADKVEKNSKPLATARQRQQPSVELARKVNEQAVITQLMEREQIEQAKIVAREIQHTQLDQMAIRRRARQERVLDAKALREQLEWELAQAEMAELQLARDSADSRRWLGQQHQLALQAQSILSAIRATVSQFVDSLAVRPACEAIEIVTREQDALVSFCMDKCSASITEKEQERIRAELLDQIVRARADLESRRLNEEREQRLEIERKQAKLDVQAFQQVQIARHLDAKCNRKAQDAATREIVQRTQEVADHRAAAALASKKHRSLVNNQYLLEQIHNNKAARSLFPLHTQGCSSPVYRTPYWSDESEEQRLEGFVRKDVAFRSGINNTLPGAESPAIMIHGKKSTTWYD